MIGTGEMIAGRSATRILEEAAGLEKVGLEEQIRRDRPLRRDRAISSGSGSLLKQARPRRPW
jgi:hypothetical protein